MVRRRLIFTLLFAEGFYNLSRNFRLQKVGDLDWVLKNYDFESISRSIDELILLDVNRDGNNDVDALCTALQQLGGNCFMPFAAGGGIRNLGDAQKLFQAGADKLVLNTAYFTDPEFVRDATRTFGKQSVLASLDYRRDPDGERRVYIENGTRGVDMTVGDAVAHVQEIGAGEVYLTSIDHDGVASGYDIDVLPLVAPLCSVPIIISGGAGFHSHFSEAFNGGLADAASTANLFNFMADGLADARASLLDEGVDLSVWNFGR